MPRDFYSMEIKDAALMFQGWADEQLLEQHTARTMTIILADTINRSMGGKGAAKHIIKLWPLKGDKKDVSLDRMLQKLKAHKDRELASGIKRNKDGGNKG